MSVSSPQDSIDAGRLKGSGLLNPSIVEWWVRDFMRPIEDFCVKQKITPNQITTMGFILTLLAALFLALGHLIWGGWLVIIAGCFDFFDGRVARRLGLSSEAGAFYDSCLDRYMDLVVLFALAYYFRASPVSILVYLSILGSAATPYIRAKSESLGIPSSGGAMQRPERIAYIGLGAAFSGYLMILLYPFHEVGKEHPPYLLILALGIVAFMSNKVAIERFYSTFRALQARDRSR